LTTLPPLLPSNPTESTSKLWFKRHWKWAIPLGLLVLAAGALTFSLGLVHLMKQCDAYQMAFNRARTDPAVIEQLGEPIRDGWFLQGNIDLTNDDGTANISFPLKGPKGEGKVYVDAKKTAGRWHFRQLEVVTDWGRRHFDLSDPPDRAVPAVAGH
jgi:hypothetical protein